jgi:hypothetical protein
MYVLEVASSSAKVAVAARRGLEERVRVAVAVAEAGRVREDVSGSG